MPKVTLEAPKGLTDREHAAYRLGLLRFLIRAAEDDELKTPPVGILLESLRNEMAYREQELRKEES